MIGFIFSFEVFKVTQYNPIKMTRFLKILCKTLFLVTLVSLAYFSSLIILKYFFYCVLLKLKRTLSYLL